MNHGSLRNFDSVKTELYLLEGPSFKDVFITEKQHSIVQQFQL